MYAYAGSSPLDNTDPSGLVWIYQQSSGEIWHVLNPDTANASIDYVGSGYSGNEEGLNNPDEEDVPFVGPIPEGTYSIGSPYDSAKTGPNSLPLTPEYGTDTYGRSSFLIHGDNSAADFSGSEGCIVTGPSARATIINSDDNTLEVVP